jgi:methyl-accepting chemotaxis protein
MLSVRYVSIRTKLVLMVGVLFGGFGIYGIVSWRQASQLQVNGPIYQSIVSGKDLVADILPPPEYILEAYLTTNQLADERYTRSITALQDKLHRLQLEFESRHEYWSTHLPAGSLKTLITEDAYKPAREFFAVVSADLVPQINSRDYNTAQQLFSGKLTDLYNAHRSAIDKAVAKANDLNASIESSAQSTIASGKLTLMIIAAIGLILALSATWLVTGLIVRPVKKLSLIATRVSEGDINCIIDDVPSRSRDEVDQLNRSFQELVSYMKGLSVAAELIAANDLTASVQPKSDKDVLGKSFKIMIANLSGMIRQLAEHARELVSAATEIASSSELMSRGARDQSDQVNQVSTAVEEMTATIVESSKNASEASKAAKSAADTATTGGAIVNDSIQAMQTIAQTVRQSADSIAKLATSADQIGAIISVIDDIADQTNLLALNAAIEAARAGEQGRGFAVVADEVRKLAERTGKATGEITDMIKGIQRETVEAVHSMETGIQVVDRGRELSDQAGSSLHEIVAMAQQVTEMIRQMATAAEEQSAASEQIAKSVESISGVTKETASGAEQSAAAAEELSRQAEGLQKMVSQFRLDGGNVGILHLAKDDHKRYIANLTNSLKSPAALGSWKRVDHKNCRLGKWYYGDGKVQYGQYSEFGKIEEAHAQVHRSANDAIAAKLAGNDVAARRLLEEADQASRRVIQDLDQLANALGVAKERANA